MSAETLRRAAALMRERAEAAFPSPWEHTGMLGNDYDDIVDCPGATSIVAETDTSAENAAHIASWHPAVALAVADWLDMLGRLAQAIGVQEMSMASQGNYAYALTIAGAYLGEIERTPRPDPEWCDTCNGPCRDES